MHNKHVLGHLYYLRNFFRPLNNIYFCAVFTLFDMFYSGDPHVNVLVKTNLKRKYSVHELFGFDVILDENLKPWIVEVNISPR